MDFVVLWVTRIIIRNHKNICRLVFSSLIGAFYAVIMLVTGFKGLFTYLCTYFLIAECMCLIAYGRAGLKKSIKNLTVLYLVTFTLGGLVDAFYYGTDFGKTVLEKAVEGKLGNLSFSFILCLTIIVFTIIMVVKEKIISSVRLGKNILETSLYVKEEKIDLIALCDTGNSLREPITEKPVSVVEKRCLKQLNMEKLKYLLVPYHTVGNPNGLMRAFMADSLKIGKTLIQNPMIGIYEGKLSQDEKYQMILHPSLIEDKES
jgi:stage II sporulation protein GA (sporulation sigma-E factor processing peptidase)